MRMFLCRSMWLRLAGSELELEFMMTDFGPMVRETMSIITSMVWNTTLALEPLSSPEKRYVPYDREPIPACRVHIWQTQLAGMACGPARRVLKSYLYR